VVVSNGVINLCAHKRAVFDEVVRVLRPAGVLQFADITRCRRAHCATSTWSFRGDMQLIGRYFTGALARDVA
jgi:ubiquinone/menaquinone biosynthesis C-methylase UbiE